MQQSPLALACSYTVFHEHIHTHKWEGIMVKKKAKRDAQKQMESMTLIWILDSGKNHFWDQKGNRKGGARYRSAAMVTSVRWDSGTALVSPYCSYSASIYKQTDMMFHLLWNTRAKWKTGKLEENRDHKKLTTTTKKKKGYLFTAWECCRRTTQTPLNSNNSWTVATRKELGCMWGACVPSHLSALFEFKCKHHFCDF